MLKHLKLRNFKAFQDLDGLELKPITILCGTNSCGKSTILQSILLLKQSLESQDPNQTLSLNGRFVHLGTFENVIYRKDLSRHLGIDMTFDVSGDTMASRRSGQGFPLIMVLRDTLSEEFFKDASEDSMQFKLGVKITFEYIPEDISRIQQHVKPISINSLEFTVTADLDTSKSSRVARIRLTRELDGLYSAEFSNYNSKFLNTPNFGQSLRIDFANLFPSKIEDPDIANAKNNFAGRIQYAFHPFNWLMKEIFSRYTYLGPLREAPARRYIYEDAVLEIGLKGENAPYLHLTEKWTSIKDHYFYDSDKDSFSPQKDIYLGDAVKKWLKLMNIQGFEPRRHTELVYVELDSGLAPDTRVNISDVGFGVSQIFPIILEGLRMGRYDTLLLEQPEIHLHPNVQMQMSDYLVSLALSGKQVVVETHSDHIVNRLVRRIVEDESDHLAKLVGIYFVRPTKTGSLIEPVKISPDRGIINWPSEFFDQTAIEQERILRAGLKKRVSRRSNGGSL